MRNLFSWSIGLLMVLVLLAAFALIGYFFGTRESGTDIVTQELLPVWVAALATVSIALLTIFLAKETWELRQIQLLQIDKIRKDSLKPSVNFVIKSSLASYQFMDVIIRNSGAGPALDIKFDFRSNENSDDEVFEFLQNEFKKLSMLEHGISSLLPNEFRTSYLFSFLNLGDRFKDKWFKCDINVDVYFQDIEGTEYHSVSTIYLSEYRGITELGGGDPVQKISSALEKIEKHIGHLTTGFGKLKTDIYTSDDRRLEKEQGEATIPARKSRSDKVS
jgi:hypothetical protein